MNTFLRTLALFVTGLAMLTAGVACDAVAAGGGGSLLGEGDAEEDGQEEGQADDGADEVDDGETGSVDLRQEGLVYGNGADPLQLEVFATNTGGASGIAFDADGDLYLVNKDGLFGPITDGEDVSAMTPIGATNLAAGAIFDADQDSFVLAISGSGDFWIGSQCCVTLAVVPADGGDAEPFTGLADGPTDGDPSNIKSETMVMVPDDYDSLQIVPGTMLVGRETSFSELSTIDVDGDLSVLNIDNPLEDRELADYMNRNAHHLTFGPDGTLYTSRSVTSPDFAGLQTVQADGSPVELPGTINLSANTFVVLDSGDIILDGIYDPADGDRVMGLLIWSGESETVMTGLEMPEEEVSEDDEMILGPDGTIYLSLPDRNEIVRVVDNRE